jgi:type I restriction enzyme S subunit
MQHKEKIKSKSWRKIKLGEWLELKYGFGLPEEKRIKGNIPVYGSSGVVGYHNEPAVNTQGIIIGRKGNVGAVYFSSEPFYPIDTVYFIDSLKKDGDLKFFYYLLKTIDFKKVDINVGVPGLNRDTAHSLEVVIPEDINEQKRIADILSAFDDKIELNNKIIKTLEEMAQEVFKGWFIKFNFPVEFEVKNEKLKVKNLGYKDAGGKFVDSELGKIPEGWEVGYLGDGTYSEIIKPRVKKFEGEKIYLATADVEKNEIVNEKTKISYNNRPIRANMEPVLNSIWFAKMINTYKVLFFFEGNKEDITKYILSTGFMGIQALKNMQYYLYLFINSKEFHQIKDTLVQGAVQEAITNTNVKQIEFLVPPEILLDEFNKKVEPLLIRAYKLKKENQKLAELRDLLLPKLMSGEILVNSE